jgi:hypothetical protein
MRPGDRSRAPLPREEAIGEQAAGAQHGDGQPGGRQERAEQVEWPPHGGGEYDPVYAQGQAGDDEADGQCHGFEPHS